MNIEQLRREFDKLGWQVMDYCQEETFQLRQHGNIDNNETIYNLTELEEKLFEWQGELLKSKTYYKEVGK